MTVPTQGWSPLEPSFQADVDLYRQFRSRVHRLTQIAQDEPDFVSVVQEYRQAVLASLRAAISPAQAEMRVAFSVLADLYMQGWGLKVDEEKVYWSRPGVLEDVSLEKERIRSGLLVARDEQLREPPVRDFIKNMEQARLHEGRWVSVFSLMRDGEALAQDLSTVASLEGTDTYEERLLAAIQPYIEVADSGRNCAFTGLKLLDVWRYFRHTWLTPMRSTPGRSMPILIRDAAVENHPVIGIAALSSSIVQQSERDKWIGWRGEDVLQQMDKGVSEDDTKWLLTKLEELTKGVFFRDFIDRKLIRQVELIRPSWQGIERLRSTAEEHKEAHKMLPPGSRSKAGANGNWKAEAATDLFISKRASTLADLLDIRLAFNHAGFTTPDVAALQNALKDDAFRLAVAKLVRRVKATNVGINMMDISVAGAVEPYRPILGGKLVSLLLCSPEIVAEYERRYKDQPSVIASAIKGRAVRKDPTLALLCTTGLFGVGSSQYNRLAITTEKGQIRFEKLDQRTEYGTFHFSQATMLEIKRLSEIDFQGTITNGIFGEGVNPKMRKIRECLDRIGLPSTEFLKHSSPRVVYVIPLCRNFRDVLLGRSDKPDYFLPKRLGRSGTKKIAETWALRWLSPRIRNTEILEAVKAHAIGSPYTHGAKVILPTIDEEQSSLFEEIEDDV